MENYHLSKHTASWKESMINRLSNLINRNRSAAKISQVLCSNANTRLVVLELLALPLDLLLHVVRDEAGHQDLIHLQGAGKPKLKKELPNLVFGERLLWSTPVDCPEVLEGEKTLLKERHLLVVELGLLERVDSLVAYHGAE